VHITEKLALGLEPGAPAFRLREADAKPSEWIEASAGEGRSDKDMRQTKNLERNLIQSQRNAFQVRRCRNLALPIDAKCFVAGSGNVKLACRPKRNEVGITKAREKCDG